MAVRSSFTSGLKPLSDVVVESEVEPAGAMSALKAMGISGISGMSTSNRDRIQGARVNERRGMGLACKCGLEWPRLSWLSWVGLGLGDGIDGCVPVQE